MGLFKKISGSLGGKKREEFYASYAESHGLTRSKQRITPVTKNLGGELETDERFDGPLVPGVEGTIGLVNVTIRSSVQMVTTERDASINEWMMPEGTVTTSTESSVNSYPSTVVLIPLEKTNAILSGLAVKGNYKKQSTGDRETYGDLTRVGTDGLDLAGHFYVYADQGADAERVRALFTPEFSAWLNAREFRFFSFEVGEGTLVLKHPKHAKDAEQLDAYVAEATEIARQLEAAA